MRPYRITCFSPKRTKEYTIVYANTVEQAENSFKVPDGYSVLSVVEVNDFNLTLAQENAVAERLDKILSTFIKSESSREAIIECVIDRVMMEIGCGIGGTEWENSREKLIDGVINDDRLCSTEWWKLQSDEWVESDIDIALQSVLEQYLDLDDEDLDLNDEE